MTDKCIVNKRPLLRQSNFELLRIVSMFLVLIVHADFLSLGIPTDWEIINHPVSSMLRYIVQSLALVCVNSYVLVSGYYGIHTNVKSVLRFAFIVIFWRMFINFTWLGGEIFGFVEGKLTIQHFIMLCIPGNGDWFVMAYIVLLLIAPILNSFGRHCSARKLWIYVLLYEGVQVIYSWVLHIESGFNSGYSVLSFIGLYLIGAAICKSNIRKNYSPLALYLILSISAGVTVYIARRFFPHSQISLWVESRFDVYNSIIVILASVFLFLFFQRLRIISSTINKIAASTFAVYLMHMHPLIRDIYCEICKKIYYDYSNWRYLLLISLFITGVFIIAILIDRVRLRVWRAIEATENYRLICGILQRIITDNSIPDRI